MKIKSIYLSVITLQLLFKGLTVSAQSWLWGVQGTGSLKAGVWASNVATNKTGNVYQTGVFETSISFGTITLTTLTRDNVYLVKYDQNGNVLWTKQSIGTTASSAQGNSVATDDSDNSYITGFTTDTIAFGSYILDVPPNSFLPFIVKYNPNGDVIWAKLIDTAPLDYQTESWGMAADKIGHEYITGEGAFLLKYDRNGKIIWDVIPTNTNKPYTVGFSIAPDIFGNTYITGQFEDTITFGAYQIYSEKWAAFIAKFDSNGNVLWVQQSNNFPNSNVFQPSIATDRSGAAYLTGYFSDTTTLGSYKFISPNDSSYNFFVVKYNPNGTIAWAKQDIPINNGSWGCWSVCTDDSNHIYISGGEVYPGKQGQNASFIFASDTFSVTYSANNDNASFLLKLDSLGNVICSSILNNGGGDVYNAVTSDSAGKFIYMGGGFTDLFTLGKDSLIDKTGEGDPYVARWQPCFQCNLVVNSTPQTPSICSGQSITLTASGGSNYIWSPANGLSATTGASVVANPNTITTYNIFSSINSCSDTGEIVVNVFPVTPLVVYPPSPSLCAYSSATLYVKTKGSDFTWNPAIGLNTTTGTSVIASPTATVTYTVTCIDSLGCEATGQDVVNIIHSPNKPSFVQHNDTLISSAAYDNQWYRNDSLLLWDTSQYLIISTTGNYYVEVNNEANGCTTSSDTVPITSLTGINQLTVERGQLTVYPNPTSDQLTIISNQFPITEIDVANELGQILLKIPTTGFRDEIDLSEYPGGIYFISVINSSGRTVVPVVKE